MGESIIEWPRLIEVLRVYVYIKDEVSNFPKALQSHRWNRQVGVFEVQSSSCWCPSSAVYWVIDSGFREDRAYTGEKRKHKVCRRMKRILKSEAGVMVLVIMSNLITANRDSGNVRLLGNNLHQPHAGYVNMESDRVQRILDHIKGSLKESFQQLQQQKLSMDSLQELQSGHEGLLEISKIDKVSPEWSEVPPEGIHNHIHRDYHKLSNIHEPLVKVLEAATDNHEPTGSANEIFGNILKPLDKVKNILQNGHKLEAKSSDALVNSQTPISLAQVSHDGSKESLDNRVRGVRSDLKSSDNTEKQSGNMIYFDRRQKRSVIIDESPLDIRKHSVNDPLCTRSAQKEVKETHESIPDPYKSCNPENVCSNQLLSRNISPTVQQIPSIVMSSSFYRTNQHLYPSLKQEDSKYQETIVSVLPAEAFMKEKQEFTSGYNSPLRIFEDSSTKHKNEKPILIGINEELHEESNSKTGIYLCTRNRKLKDVVGSGQEDNEQDIAAYTESTLGYSAKDAILKTEAKRKTTLVPDDQSQAGIKLGGFLIDVLLTTGHVDIHILTRGQIVKGLDKVAYLLSGRYIQIEIWTNLKRFLSHLGPTEGYLSTDQFIVYGTSFDVLDIIKQRRNFMDVINIGLTTWYYVILDLHAESQMLADALEEGSTCVLLRPSLYGEYWVAYTLISPGDGSKYFSYVGTWTEKCGLQLTREIFPKRARNLRGRSLIVGVINKPRVLQIKELTNSSSSTMHGYSYDILVILQEHHNFSIIPTIYTHWGSPDENGSWDGVIGALHQKEIDFSPMDFTPTMESRESRPQVNETVLRHLYCFLNCCHLMNTVLRFTAVIDNHEKLSSNTRVIPVTEVHSNTMTMLMESDRKSFQKLVARIQLLEPSFIDTAKFFDGIAAGKWAFVDTASSSYGRALDYENERGRCRFYKSRSSIVGGLDAWPFPRNSPVHATLSKSLKWLRYYGILEHIKARYYRPRCYSTKDAKKNNEGSKKMDLGKMQASFYILGLGLCLGFLNFLAELLLFFFKRCCGRE
nr:uncharacterized protein LOC128687123 [Cherax quadricarinatus]